MDILNNLVKNYSFIENDNKNVLHTSDTTLVMQMSDVIICVTDII